MPKILTLNNSSLVKNGYKLVYGDDTVYYIHLYQDIGGTITANTMTGYYGDIVTLYNNPSAGYSFDGYDITGSTLTGVQVRFNREDIYVSPSFTHNVYNINLQQTTGGTITSDKSTGYYGDTVTLSNTPAEHYGFRDYSITGATLTGNKFTINESNVTAKANFSAWPVRNVSVQQRTGGTIASNKSTGYDGDVVTLSNTADTGYTFTNYNVTGATLTGNQFAFNGGNVTAQGAFNHNVYNLTLQQTTGGTITADKTTGYYGNTITLSNTANAGYYFDNYSITGSTLTGNKFKFNTNNVTAKANFKAPQYDVLNSGNSATRAYTFKTISSPLNNNKYFGLKYIFKVDPNEYYPVTTQNEIRMYGTYYSAGYNIEYTDEIMTNRLTGLWLDYPRYPYASAGVLIFALDALNYSIGGTLKTSIFYPNTANSYVYSAYNSAINPSYSTYGDKIYWLYRKNYDTNDINLKYVFEEASNGRDNVYVYTDNVYAGSSYTDMRKDKLQSEYWKRFEYFGCGGAIKHASTPTTYTSGHISWTAFATSSLKDAVAI